MKLPFNPKLVQSRLDVNPNPSKIGQAVYDILSKNQPVYTVEDILSGYKEKYEKDFNECVERGHKKFNRQFYVIVLSNKPPYAPNVQSCWFVDRSTAPHATDMVGQYPHHFKTLYLVDAIKGKMKILWSLPGIEDCKSIMKNPHIYDPQLVKWVDDCAKGKLDLDNYSFDDFKMIA